MENEIWKDIPGYEGLYQVSNLGMVKAMKKKWISGNGKVDFRDEKILKQFIVRGYKQVCLSHNGKFLHLKVHRLVLSSFKGFGGLKWTVNHIDGDKLNNNLSNLEWATVSENLKHAYRIGIKKPLIGLNHQHSRIVLNTETGIFYNATDAAKSIGIKNSTLGAMLRGRNPNTTSFVYV